MTAEQIATLAKRVHDEERWNLGASSTRDTRNQYWARVVGIVHHGHPRYNDSPDPRWHLKSAGNGRPQSDDVAVLMPSRQYWDFIGGVGADGYTFRAGAHPEPLEASQPVFPPPVPAGGGGVEPKPEPQPGGGQQPQPQPTACGYDKDAMRVLTSAVVNLTNQLAHMKSDLAGLNERLDEEWAARVWNATDPDKPGPTVQAPDPPDYVAEINLGPLKGRATLRPVQK
jgi:hypothetical protein